MVALKLYKAKKANSVKHNFNAFLATLSNDITATSLISETLKIVTTWPALDGIGLQSKDCE